MVKIATQIRGRVRKGRRKGREWKTGDGEREGVWPPIFITD